MLAVHSVRLRLSSIEGSETPAKGLVKVGLHQIFPRDVWVAMGLDTHLAAIFPPTGTPSTPVLGLREPSVS